MTALDTASDVESIEHLDFEPACILRVPVPCPNSARWVMRFRCCGHSWLICEDHRAHLRGVATGKDGFICGRCKTVTVNLDALVEFTPIKAGS